jgi:DNA-binding HxlR family transcriptional regulator
MPYERKREPLDPCPVEEVLELIAGKWKARILYLIGMRPQTFAELRRGLPGITQQVLAEQLRALVGDGIVNRERTIRGNRVFSLYALTGEGESLMPLLNELSLWGTRRLRDRGIVWEAPK